MVEWLESLPLVTMGVVVIGGFMVYAALLVFIEQRLYPAENFLDHLHAAGFIHALIGVMYAVVLGFVAVGVWERFDSAENTTYDEAARWQNVYQDASALGIATTVQKDVRVYLNDVATKEWAAMNSPGDSRDPETAAMANKLQHEIAVYNPKNPHEVASQQDMLSNLSQAAYERNQRTVAFNSGVNPAVWFVIFVGGFVTIAFTLLFGFKRKALQYVMLCTMAGVIGLAIFMTLALDYPFEGEVSVRPEAFVSTLQNLDKYDEDNGIHSEGPRGPKEGEKIHASSGVSNVANAEKN